MTQVVGMPIASLRFHVLVPYFPIEMYTNLVKVLEFRLLSFQDPLHNLVASAIELPLLLSMSPQFSNFSGLLFTLYMYLYLILISQLYPNFPLVVYLCGSVYLGLSFIAISARIRCYPFLLPLLLLLSALVSTWLLLFQFDVCMPLAYQFRPELGIARTP